MTTVGNWKRSAATAEHKGRAKCRQRIRAEGARQGKQNGRGNRPNPKRQKREADAAIATIGDMDNEDSF